MRSGSPCPKRMLMQNNPSLACTRCCAIPTFNKLLMSVCSVYGTCCFVPVCVYVRPMWVAVCAAYFMRSLFWNGWNLRWAATARRTRKSSAAPRSVGAPARLRWLVFTKLFHRGVPVISSLRYLAYMQHTYSYKFLCTHEMRRVYPKFRAHWNKTVRRERDDTTHYIKRLRHTCAWLRLGRCTWQGSCPSHSRMTRGPCCSWLSGSAPHFQ